MALLALDRHAFRRQIKWRPRERFLEQSSGCIARCCVEGCIPQRIHRSTWDRPGLATGAFVLRGATGCEGLVHVTTADLAE